MNKPLLVTTILLLLSPLFLKAQENTAITCSDGIDNDGDGLIDCLDNECANLPTDMDRGCQTCLTDGLSFADTLVSSNITCPTNTNNNPQAAIGVADFAMIGDDVSIGEGGSITLGFTNNLLVNSGDDNPDIWVFEVGPRVETCQIELRPADQNTIDILNSEGITDSDGDGLYSFGTIANFTSSVDIDAFVDGYNFSELKFDAIQITDVADECVGAIPGADIDAVCALTSIPILRDCAGVVNGTAILDNCGVCLEPTNPNFNQSCIDCAGVPNGTAMIDSCGVCLETTDPNFNQSCLDCNEVPNGIAILDSCGVCLEPNDPNFNQSCSDCAGILNGTAILDSCGVCLEPNAPSFNQSCSDCAGVLNGTAILDSCGVCLELTDPDFNQSCLDCAGIPNGMAVLDSCGVCLEPTDLDFNQSCIDCAGLPNGMAVLDSCGVCLEPTDPNFNQSCLDCNSIPNGTAIIDNCGICLEPTDPNFNQSCSEKNQIYIPNAFSPNGDGKNDFFEIFKPRALNVTINTYLIFNRWGSLVYKASNFDFNTASVNWWDGTFNKEEMDNGVFLYYIEIEIENVGIKQYEGTVSIIR